jgi:hypothetical protein
MPCLPFININYYLSATQVSIKCSTVRTRLGDVSLGKFISQFKCRNKWRSYVPIFQNVVMLVGEAGKHLRCGGRKKDDGKE